VFAYTHKPTAISRRPPISRFGAKEKGAMQELIRTNDPVLLSFIQALLDEQEIVFHVADEAISSVEGSIGILPRRVLVVDDDIEKARRMLQEAGIGLGSG
jgi:hypothetical protein